MIHYWVLKTVGNAVGRDGRIIYGASEDMWPHFKGEGVIALGWKMSHDMAKRINDMDEKACKEALADDLSRAYLGETAQSPQAHKKNAGTICKFIKGMDCDDRVLLSRGYAANTGNNRDVRIYGHARIKGSFWYDETSKWWKIKRKAEIFPIEKAISKGDLARILNKGSLMQTIHEIDEDSFDQVLDRFGLKVDG